jgi:hypothetical protein
MIYFDLKVLSSLKGPAVDCMKKEGELSPDFIKRHTWLKWECPRTGVSLDVLQYPFPKPLIYKQLKEKLSLHKIVITLSRQKTRHLKIMESKNHYAPSPWMNMSS